MDELDKQIGTKEPKKLTAGDVIVKAVSIQQGGEGTKKFKIVALEVLHQEKEETIKISNLKIKTVQGNNETIKKDGIWYREDEDGNIDKYCNASKLLNFYGKKSLKEFVNTSIKTEADSLGYLCVKAY